MRLPRQNGLFNDAKNPTDLSVFVVKNVEKITNMLEIFGGEGRGMLEMPPLLFLCGYGNIQGKNKVMCE